MLVVHNPANAMLTQIIDVADSSWHISHDYNGYDTLEFEVQDSYKYASWLLERAKVDSVNTRSGTTAFIIRNVDRHGGFITVSCDIDVSAWQRTVFETYRKTGVTLANVLDDIKPSDWSYVGAAAVTDRLTIEEQGGQAFQGATPLDILQKAAELFDVVFNFDNVNNTLLVITKTNLVSSGQFFTDELNLKSVGFVGNSSSFATRLYAYGKRDDDGKNPVTFASINGGKPYVDDNTYSSEIVSVGWSDERYTVKEDLLRDAKKKLKELAKPKRSYECEIAYFGEGLWMYKVVTLVDRYAQTKQQHQVVGWDEYGDSTLDKVTLSSYAIKLGDIFDEIGHTITSVSIAANDKIEAAKTSIAKDVQAAIEKATSQITGNSGGYFKWMYDAEGRPIELLNLGDSKDINTARRVWRWNAAGLGHSNTGYNGAYDLALMRDGSINASVITTGIMQANLIKAGVLSDKYNNNKWDLESGELTTRKGFIGGLTISDSSVYNKVFKLHSGGVTFMRGADVGTIGTNYIRGFPNYLGLIFQLDPLGAYMSWATRPSVSDDTYYMKWTYFDEELRTSTGTINADTLSAGCSIDGGNWPAKHLLLDSSSSGAVSGITSSFRFVQILQMQSDGRAANWAGDAYMSFQRGFLIGLRVA